MKKGEKTMLLRLNVWLLLACVSVLGITEAQTKRVHVPIRVDVIVSTGKARTLKGGKRKPTKKVTSKKVRTPQKKQPVRNPAKSQKKPPVRTIHSTRATATKEATELKAQLAVTTQRINELTRQYRLTSLKAGQAENLAVELLDVTRRLDEANLALASGQSSTKLIESFRNLNKQIDVLSFQLAQQRQEAEYHQSTSKSQAEDISLFKSAVASYILSEEKLLRAYQTYESLFSSVLEHTPQAVQAARKELSESWQGYLDAIDTLNRVLRQIGMLTHIVKINPLYKNLVEGALEGNELPAAT